MPVNFDIHASPDRITVDSNNAASAVFTVTNTSGQSVRARAAVRPGPGLHRGWFHIPDPERVFADNGVQRFDVSVQIPLGTPAGEREFTIIVAAVDNPDEDFRLGQPVWLEIPATPPPPTPPKKFPWWIVGVVAGGVALVVGISLLIYFLARDTQPVDACLNAADHAFIEPASPPPTGTLPAFELHVVGCGIACMGQVDKQTCADQCMQGSALSEDCATCYGQWLGCMLDHCGAQVTSPNIKTCHDTHCKVSFESCTGRTKPHAAW